MWYSTAVTPAFRPGVKSVSSACRRTDLPTAACQKRSSQLSRAIRGRSRKVRCPMDRSHAPWCSQSGMASSWANSGLAITVPRRQERQFMFQLRERVEVAAQDSLRSVAEIVDTLLPAFGTRPAIRYDDGQTYVAVRFDEYLKNVRRMISFLGCGCDEPRVVATFVKNRPEWDM